MNAYELADQVEMWGEDLLALNMKGGIPVVQGAKMLRQQADLIRNLQKSLGFKNSGYETINLTPQTKPLSDEEIKEVMSEVGVPSDYHENYMNFFKETIKAIEERHGIK